MRITKSVDIPADLVDEAKARREKLVEAVSAIDDDLMAKYLEGEESLGRRDPRRSSKGTLAMKIVARRSPVQHSRTKGVQTLLDAVVDFLP